MVVEAGVARPLLLHKVGSEVGRNAWPSWLVMLPGAGAGARAGAVAVAVAVRYLITTVN